MSYRSEIAVDQRHEPVKRRRRAVPNLQQQACYFSRIVCAERAHCKAPPEGCSIARLNMLQPTVTCNW